MNLRSLFFLTAVTGVAGCELESQKLPFDVNAVVTRSIPAQGGTVSTSGGASVHFPDGALGGGAQVTLTPTSVSAPMQAIGTVTSRSFTVDAGSAPLARAATMELKLTKSVDPNRLWLASIVSYQGAKLTTYGNSRVDLTAGVINAKVQTLGVMAAVIPPAWAVTPVSSRVFQAVLPFADVSTSSTSSTVQRLVVDCGGTAAECAGLSAVASQNVLDLTEESAILNPVASGGFQRTATGAATGSLVATGTLRVLLQGRQSAESIGVDALLEATPSSNFSESATEITITNVRHRISGTDSRPGEDIATLVMRRNGGTAMVSIQRAFELRDGNGVAKPADVTITFPLTIQ